MTRSSEPTFRACPDRESLADALASHVAGVVHGAVAARGTCTLVLSGGTTPAALFARLAALDGLPWARTVLTLSDERWVEPDDPASNEGMVRRTLAPALAKGARFIGLKGPGTAPADGLAETERHLAGVPRPFDLVLLGMGEDGHTASLFPGGEGLAAALAGHGRLAAGVIPAIPGPPRVTLTLPTLLQAREIALLITGPAKRAVYDAALRPGPVEEFPVRGVLHQAAAPVTTWWAP